MNYDIIDKSIAEGKLWKAKEALQGRLRSEKFDPDILRRYGEVLLQMGDLIEAGRMLFCSGARNEEFREAIGLFLDRQPRDQPRQFLSTLPLMIRRHEHLAEFIASPKFEHDGWTHESLLLVQAGKPVSEKISHEPTIKDRAIICAIAGFLLTVVILCGIGFYTVVAYAWAAIFA